MASSSSWIKGDVQDQPTIRRLNDALYELHKPRTGSVDIEIIFFHGFQSQSCEEAYLKTWMLPEHSECWLNTWLAQNFPQARILSVSYDSSTQVSDSAGRMDMYVVGESLVHSIVGLEGIGQTCPVVLVGHSTGGLVLKQVCLQAEQIRATQGVSKSSPYTTFLENIQGAFFYSTPNSGSHIKTTATQRGPLLQYLELLSKDAAILGASFAKLRHLHRWKTFGLLGASETEDSRSIVGVPNRINQLFGRKQSSLVVEEGSARFDMDDFCVLPGLDNFTICKPRDRSSSSFLLLVKFLQGILEIEGTVVEQWITSLELPRIFVDIPRLVDQVIRELHLGEAEPSRLALVGMGGIGKTTLAKAVLLRIHTQFHFCCFVEDLKDMLKRNNVHLHNVVAENLCFGSGRKVRMHDTDAQSVWFQLLGKRVLMILDNVECEEQISSLLSSNWLGSGSRVIATTRLQNRAQMPTFDIFKVPLLSSRESETLFHAHLDPGVLRKVPHELIEKVMQKCDGLPLALEVVGSYLRFEKTITIWTSAFDKLKRAESVGGTEDDRLWAKLQISLDDLAKLERGMFLDLAVFDACDPYTKQYDLEIWKAVWETGLYGSPVDIGLRNLVDRSLIVIKSIIDNPEEQSTKFEVTTVKLHEQLRDLGRSICRPPAQKIELCSRVWRMEDITSLLRTYKGNQASTEALSLSSDPTAGPTTLQGPYVWSSLADLQQLRLLRLSKVSMTGSHSHRFPYKLAVLHMTACPRPPARKFHIFGSDSWPIREEDVDGLHYLSVLRLDFCTSVRLPSNFHRLSNLKILIIRGKHLKNLPQQFGYLPSLKVLVLENVGLSRLPNSFFQLSTLQTLKLKGCSSLTGWLPSSLRKISSPLSMLTNLRLEDLHGLTELPDTLGRLGSLEIVTIARCFGLRKLPEGFGDLENLRRLEISKCPKLESLCESLGELIFLEGLNIEYCPLLKQLPKSLGQLPSLNLLLVKGTKITRLPKLTSSMESLEFLFLVNLPDLQRLPESLGQLKILQVLRIEGCGSLSRLPKSFGELHGLQQFTVPNCRRLEKFPVSLGQLRKLTRLEISDCQNLTSLPDSLGQLKTLLDINLENCINLQAIPESVGQLKSLTRFLVRGCTGLERLPESMGQLQALRCLDIRGAANLSYLPNSVWQLKALQRIALPQKYKAIAPEGLLTHRAHVLYSKERPD